jgi:hypothetical protein
MPPLVAAVRRGNLDLVELVASGLREPPDGTTIDWAIAASFACGHRAVATFVLQRFHVSATPEVAELFLPFMSGLSDIRMPIFDATAAGNARPANFRIESRQTRNSLPMDEVARLAVRPGNLEFRNF